MNQTYHSPYQRRIEFPIADGSPAKERAKN